MNIMNSFSAVPFEDDSNGHTRNDLNDLERRDAVTDEKCELAILKEEKRSSDDDNGDFEDYSYDSNDNNISHDVNSNVESYGKAQHGMSEKSNSFRRGHENNYSHIAYVLECMEDELGEKQCRPWQWR